MINYNRQSYIKKTNILLQALLDESEKYKPAYSESLSFNYNCDCFCLYSIFSVPHEIHFNSVVHHSQDKASISPAPFLLTEDCSVLYIWCLSAITMWFGGLELSLIYERHIALQERDDIFKWVKRVRLSLC